MNRTFVLKKWATLALGALLLAVSGFSAAAQTPQGQEVEVRGRVVDDRGEAVVGAAVVQEGTTNGTATDIDGNYSLRVPPGATLVVSYIGYSAARQEVGGRAVVDFTLAAADTRLDELVVVGFGTQRKVNLTGSVSVADAKALRERPVVSAAQALQGVVPGLQITQADGKLETSPSINIRGSGTIGSGSSGAPLILIDGVEGDINALNPQDIESISVLKDAASASIYGSRAPFGVILVTTKRGQEGRATINYNNSFRFNWLINRAHTMDSFLFACFMNDACMNTPGWNPHIDDAWMQRIIDYKEGRLTQGTTEAADRPGYWYEYDGANANTDWFDAVYKDHSTSQEHNLSVSGGTDKISYYFSANLLSQGGMIAWGKERLKRYGLTGKFSAQLRPWVNIGYSTRWVRTDYVRPSALTDDLYSQLGRQGWPLLPIYDPNGYIHDSPSPIAALANGGDDKTQTDNNYNQLSAVFTPLDGWDVHAEFNYRVKSATRHWDSQVRYNHDVDGNAYVYSRSSNVHEDYLRENFFNVNVFSNYSKTLGESHNLHLMLGFQTENMKQLKYGMQRDGILIPSLSVIDLTTGRDLDGNAITPSLTGGTYRWDTAGFFGRLNYDYAGRYLVEFNLRRDGTSRFRGNRRWITLPSVSVGWNVAQEGFWAPLQDVVGTLKLRGSYGMLGNQNTDDWYQTYRRLSINISAGDWLQGGVRPNTVDFPALVSEGLTWEKIYNYNVGLDWGLLGGRLTGSLEWFVRDTRDMVGPSPEMPAILGTDVPKSNNADLRTSGWDLEVAWNDRTGYGLAYGARLVVSDSRTKITKYVNNPTGSLDTYIQGRYTNEIWGYETIGIARDDDEMQAYMATLPNGGTSALGGGTDVTPAGGDVMYRDLNGDGKIDNGANTIDDHGDLRLIGNSTPRYTFSLDLTAAWRGLDARVFFQGVGKRDYWQGSTYFFGQDPNMWWTMGLRGHEDYFRDSGDYSVQRGYLGENRDSYYPRPVFSDYANRNRQTQTRYLQDASYVRLKNAQIGYTLPESVTGRYGISALRLYVSGENLWTGTRLNKLFDPETIGSGYGGAAYPLQRVFSFGCSLTL